jgi:hypothetical protein
MDFPHVQIMIALEECGAVVDEVSTAEHARHVRHWVDAYGDFYGPDRRRLNGGRAQEEAQRLSDGSFLLVPCRDPSFTGWSPVGAAYRCRSDRLPDLTQASHFVDAFISPEDFSWTLLYGHEVDVFGGPYFSRIEWGIPTSIERVQKREWSRGKSLTLPFERTAGRSV